MTTLKSLLLITGLIFSIQSFAQGTACIPANQPVAPLVADRIVVNADGATVDSAAWTTWKAQAGTPADVAAKQNLTCCQSLDMNPVTRMCLDKSMFDPNLVKCDPTTPCADTKKGCFPMREDDMFKLDDNSSEAQIAETTALQDIFEQQQSEVDDPKPVGGFCHRNMDCESYNCKRSNNSMFAVCVPAQTICRFADVGETANGSVECDTDLEKHTGTNKCYDPSVSSYKGPLGNIDVVPTDALRCQYALVPTAPALPEDLQPAIKLAIGTTRGMEWLFATATNDGDCMRVINYLKEKVLEKIEIRKEILRDYNIGIKKIEDNFAAISTAQKDVMEPMITTLCGDTTTPHDIAMRRATGLDYLCYMKARNEVFSLYEADMLIWTNEVNTIIDTYKSTVFSWDEDSRGGWSIGDRSYNWKNPKCRYYIDLLLIKITPKKKKRRWHTKYHTSSFAQTNQIIDSANVSKYLTYIGDENTPKAMKRGYFLDPIMPGGQGMDFKKFGNGQGMFSPVALAASMALVSPVPLVASLISGIGNGPDYNRNLRNGEMASMYHKYEGKLTDYMKGLRLPEVNEADFIVEPEMPGSYESRGCLSNIDSPNCVKFKEFVGDVRDNAFAQFLTYSKHSKSKYKNYYKSEGAFRKKLWNRYTVDLVNLQNYYTAVARLRNIQNACIDKVINQLRGGDFSGEAMGITQGNGNYYVESEGNYNTGSGPKIVKAPTIKSTQTITPYKIGLSVYNKAMKTGGNKDSVSSSSGGGVASMLAAAAGSLAARNKDIADTNAKAAAAGYNVAKEEAELRASLKSGQAGATGAGASGSGSSSSMGSGSAGNKATLDGEGEMKTSASGATGVSAGAKGGAGAGAAGSAMPGLGGLGALGSSSTSGSGTTSAQDATGMSDEEKDMMAANYDRTKNKYKTTEEDSLFQVVSKTYVRNLDKILTRKKKLDEDAASAPSTPSTP